MGGNKATEEQVRPHGVGRDVAKLVEEDFTELPLLNPERGLETVYQWLRSAAFYFKQQVDPALADRQGIIDDLEARARLGEKRYGERLRAFNGRDAQVDALQECYDGCMYTRQELEECEVKK